MFSASCSLKLGHSGSSLILSSSKRRHGLSTTSSRTLCTISGAQSMLWWSINFRRDLFAHHFGVLGLRQRVPHIACFLHRVSSRPRHPPPREVRTKSSKFSPLTDMLALSIPRQMQAVCWHARSIITSLERMDQIALARSELATLKPGRFLSFRAALASIAATLSPASLLLSVVPV